MHSFDNWKQERKKAVWLSISSDLIFDARRDLKDISAENVPVELLSKVRYANTCTRNTNSHYKYNVRMCA